MTTLELLKAARARIERPEAWTRGTAARDPDGLGVRARSKDAVCWCAAGAVVAVSGLKYMRAARRRDPAKFRAREAARPPADPVKAKARAMVAAAVRSGRMKRPDACSRCGAGGLIAGHHPDYSKPLDVDWLCYRCHGREHRHE